MNTRTNGVKMKNRTIKKIIAVATRKGAMTGTMKRKNGMAESIASPFRAAEVQIPILTEGWIWVFVANSL